MNTSVPAQRISTERAARLILQFLDLSLDVDRNRDDTAHREQNGLIYYVMDAVIAEIFLNYHDRRGWSVSLHTPEWMVGEQAITNWPSYAAQTALTMTDYIFSGTLPGQQGGAIYMSLWHRKEMVRRLERLAPERSARLRAITPDAAATRFDNVRRAVEAVRQGTSLSALAGIDDELKRDLIEFSMTAGAQEIEAYLATRLALSVLAADRAIEPAQQLERILTAPLRRVFTTLESTLSISKSDLDQIRRAAVDWFDRLKDECRRRHVEIVDAQTEHTEHSGGERRRSTAALWDDARTIALVCWASVRREQNARLVFVTADNIVFDAYRRWYANLEFADPAYSQPFCMRRLRQYAPSFNLFDSGLVRGDRYRGLFNEITQVLELMLLPLNLSRQQSKINENIVNRMRELSALRLLDKAPIVDDKGYQGLISAIKATGVGEDGRLARLTDRWRDLERAALAQADTEVQRRTQKFDDWLTGVAQETEARAAAFERYVERLIGNIEEGSRALGLPLAREVIERWRPPEGRHITRAPIALRLIIPFRSGPSDVGLALMERLEGSNSHNSDLIRADQWRDLYGQPYTMFAIAAALSLAAGDWEDGVYFGDFSLRAIQGNAATGRPPAADEDAAEIMYLAALAKRFRIGDLGPPLTQNGADRILMLHREALDLNNRCVAFYHRSFEPRKLREIRSYSERAALWLFLASVMSPEVTELAQRASGRLGSPLPKFGDPSSAIDAIDRAEGDLRRCFEIDGIKVADARRELFKNRLRRQIYTNAASAYLLRRLWGHKTPKESLFSPENPVAVARARDDAVQGRGSSVMTADILAFLAFADDEGARFDLQRMKRLERSQAVLTLDIYVVEALKNLVGANRIRPRET